MQTQTSKVKSSNPALFPIGSMVLLYMLTWIPSIYSSHVSIYTSTMDPMGFAIFNHSFLSQFPSFLPPECINASTASSSSNGSFASRWPRGSGSKPLCMLRCDALLVPSLGHRYPLVNIQKTMENHHAINGTTHYFNGHVQ